MTNIKAASIIICLIALAGFVVALGGISAKNYKVCKEQFVADASETLVDSYESGLGSIAECSTKLYRFDWYIIFYQFLVTIPALFISFCNTKLEKSKATFGFLFAIAIVYNTWNINKEIEGVWEYIYDVSDKPSDVAYYYRAKQAQAAGLLIATIANFLWILVVHGSDISKKDGQNSPRDVEAQVEVNGATRK